MAIPTTSGFCQLSAFAMQLSLSTRPENPNLRFHLQIKNFKASIPLCGFAKHQVNHFNMRFISSSFLPGTSDSSLKQYV